VSRLFSIDVRGSPGNRRDRSPLRYRFAPTTSIWLVLPRTRAGPTAAARKKMPISRANLRYVVNRLDNASRPLHRATFASPSFSLSPSLSLSLSLSPSISSSLSLRSRRPAAIAHGPISISSPNADRTIQSASVQNVRSPGEPTVLSTPGDVVMITRVISRIFILHQHSTRSSDARTRVRWPRSPRRETIPRAPAL